MGRGAGAAHLVNGHFDAHHQLEQQLARYVGKPAALLFSTGYMANLGVVQALVGKGDTVFADKLNHASLNDAMQLSRAEVKRYRHGDVAQLSQLLAKTQAGESWLLRMLYSAWTGTSLLCVSCWHCVSSMMLGCMWMMHMALVCWARRGVVRWRIWHCI